MTLIWGVKCAGAGSVHRLDILEPEFGDLYSCFPVGKMFGVLDPMIILSGFHDCMDQKYRIGWADIHLLSVFKKKKNYRTLSGIYFEYIL